MDGGTRRRLPGRRGTVTAASVGTQRAGPARAAGIAWVTIPAGTFQMGCVPGDPRCSSDEQPRHAVTLSKPFDLMTTEVTVGMFKSHGFHLEQQPIWSQSDNHPVVVVTWSEANDFCAKIGGRLPTEAEWERAARGGQEGVLYPWGDKAPTDAAGATNGAAFEGDAAQPVGQYAPNAFGVLRHGRKRLGMGGGLGEQLPADAVTDPKGSASGRVRLVRGGSYGDDPSNLRVSNRTPNRAGPREPQRRLSLRARRALKPRAGSRKPGAVLLRRRSVTWDE